LEFAALGFVSVFGFRASDLAGTEAAIGSSYARGGLWDACGKFEGCMWEARCKPGGGSLGARWWLVEMQKDEQWSMKIGPAAASLFSVILHSAFIILPSLPGALPCGSYNCLLLRELQPKDWIVKLCCANGAPRLRS